MVYLLITPPNVFSQIWSMLGLCWSRHHSLPCHRSSLQVSFYKRCVKILSAFNNVLWFFSDPTLATPLPMTLMRAWPLTNITTRWKWWQIWWPSDNDHTKWWWWLYKQCAQDGEELTRARGAPGINDSIWNFHVWNAVWIARWIKESKANI